MSIVSEILDKLKIEGFDNNQGFPEHNPEILLIGCVDARVDPTANLGFPRGKALILRNIAALIRGTSVASTQRETEAAVLEFAVKVKKVKHIVVMGHTDCGGIRAELENIELKDIKQYLSPLDDLKKEIQETVSNIEEQARLLEKEAVKMSVDNLLSYDYIKRANDEGNLELHGWVIDVASGKLIEVL